MPMTYKTHWSFKNGQDIPWERAVPLTIDQIIALAGVLSSPEDVIYTEHPNLNMEGEMELWGVCAGIITIDVSYCACYFAKDISLPDLRYYLENYFDVIKNPEKYGLEYRE